MLPRLTPIFVEAREVDEIPQLRAGAAYGRALAHCGD